MAWVVLTLAAIFAIHWLDPAVREPVCVVLVVGAVALLMGLTNLAGLSRAGRSVALVTGALALLVGVAEAALDVSYATTTALGALVVGGSWVLAGLWETLTG